MATSREHPGSNAEQEKKSAKTRPGTRSQTSKPAAGKRGASGNRSTATLPAATVAAAQKLLETVERREDTLRKALRRQKNTKQPRRPPPRIAAPSNLCSAGGMSCRFEH